MEMRKGLCALGFLVLLSATACRHSSPSDRLAAEISRHIDVVLRNEDEDDVELANQWLGTYGPPAVKPIDEALHKCTGKPATLLLSNLATIPDARVPEILLRQLSSPDPAVRAQACYGLAFQPNLDPGQVGRLIEMTKSAQDSDREWSIFALAHFKNQDANRFQEATKDPNPYVRAKAVQALNRHPSDKDLEVATKLLGDSDALVRTEAALTVLHLDQKNKAALKVIADRFEALRSGSGLDRAEAARLLERAGVREVEPLLRTLLRDKDVRVKWVAARSYGGLKGITAVPPELINNKLLSGFYAVTAATSLCKLGLKDGLPRLERAARYSDVDGARLAARSFYQLGSFVPNDTLRRLLDCDAWYVQRTAAIILADRGDREKKVQDYVDDVFAATYSSQVTNRRPAVSVIALSRSKRALDRLHELLQSTDFATRQLAMVGIKRRLNMPLGRPDVMLHAPSSWTDDLDS